MSDTIMKTYNRIPLSFTRGEGAYLYDADGHQFLDAVSGVAVCCLGHAHPAVSKAICDQASTLVHTSNLFQIPLQQQLADRLELLVRLDVLLLPDHAVPLPEAHAGFLHRVGDLPTASLEDRAPRARLSPCFRYSGRSTARH